MLNKPLIRIAVIILAIFVIVTVAVLYKQNLKQAKLKSATKFSNVESAIFNDDKDLRSEEQKRIEDINQIYSASIHSQIAINDLRSEINNLKKQVTIYGDQKNFAKLAFSYYDLRQKILAGEDYKNQLENFKLLAAFEVNLKNRATALEEALAKTKSPKDIENDFQNLIPQLINIQRAQNSGNIFDRVKSYVLQSIVIRNTDETKAQNIDKVILHIEKLLEKKSYSKAYETLEKLPQEYQKVTKQFIDDLKNFSALQDLDNNILSYLEGLA